MNSQELIEKMVASMEHLLGSLVLRRDEEATKEGKLYPNGLSITLYPGYGYVYFGMRKFGEGVGEKRTFDDPDRWQLTQMLTTQDGNLPEFDWLKEHMEERYHELRERSSVFYRWAQWLRLCLSYALLDPRLRSHFTAPLLIAIKPVNSEGWPNKSSPTVCGRSSSRCFLLALPRLRVAGNGAMIVRF